MGWIQIVASWLDPDWFQAIASVAAIGAGFAYVAFEQKWSRRREAKLQASMRIHAKLLCEEIVKWQKPVLEVFTLSRATQTPTEQQTPPKPVTAIAMELMTMPVADLGDPALATLVRLIGASAITFIDEAQQNAGTVCDAATLERMNRAAAKTVELIERLENKSRA